jgi:hypothetical protein
MVYLAEVSAKKLKEWDENETLQFGAGVRRELHLSGEGSISISLQHP